MSPRYAAHVSVGEESARLIETELGLPRGAVGTVYNGLPRLELDPASRNGSGVVLGSIGRLDEQKGYELLVDALADLPGASAVIVGDGPEREALESRASETGVADRLELAGWSDDARSYLPAFDVFVLPSRYEGFPLAIVEAMLAGLPVVAADVGSIPEAVVDGETGLVVPPDDVPALTAALRRMIDDPALRARCGEAGRLRAESRFTSDLMATTFAEIYERAAR
jgi:glycosyltransferase involved in cell wall biosynthesis